MRSLPTDIITKLAMKKQTRDNKADPYASLWIGRPTTPLTTDVFLERQKIVTGASNITDVSVAVCHPRMGFDSSGYYVAYIQNGIAKVVTSVAKSKMSNHIWTNVPFKVNIPGQFFYTKLTVQSVTATSSYEGEMYVPEKAIDGNLSTGWASANKFPPQEIIFDLGEVYTIGKIKLAVVLEAYLPMSYTYHASTDGSTYTELVSDTVTTTDFQETLIDSATARYIKVEMTNTINANFYRIAELEIYSITDPSSLSQPMDVTAQKIALAYDGTMPKTERGDVEFVTDEYPWIFWTAAGKLYAKKLEPDNESIDILAEANCTDVSAIRAMWSDVGSFDFGLVVFFILGGMMYYRQLINGEWTDAEYIAYGAAGVDWVEVSAFRTWDYRIGIQCRLEDGRIYEYFTQFMGIGKQNTEHIEISDIKATGVLTPIEYHHTKTDERIEITDIEAIGALIYGHSSVPVLVSNVDDGMGDYGFRVMITFDYPVSNTSGSHINFTFRDSRNTTFSILGTSLSGDGLELTLTLDDFNSAFEDCTVSYIPGSIQSPAVALSGFTETFLPTNLNPPQVDPPEPVEVYNT